MEKMFNEERMYTYLKTTAFERDMQQTLKALQYARKKHSSQTRKGGDPYIIHPLTMACDALSLGISKDRVIASILLHDVVEDTNTAISDLPVNKKVKKIVLLLTYTKDSTQEESMQKQRYYDNIAKNADATLAKLIDRCHNVSTMAGVFTKEKTLSYIQETRDYILPLYRHAKDQYPYLSRYLFTLKYHIVSVIDSIEAVYQINK